jgi:ADP-heptose:LPS heptosyltransferase
MKTEARILVTRTDRLGDVLLALPVLEFLRRSLPNFEIDFLVEDRYLDVIQPYLSARKIQGHGVADVKTWIETRRFAAALVLQPDTSLLKTIWRTRIPLRLSPRSKPWSFLLTNAGLRQHRSRAEKNEAEYNLDLARTLLKKMGQEESSEPLSLWIPPETTSSARALDVLEAAGIPESSRFVILHPGMGGSALNLSSEQYVDFARALLNQNILVVVSVGPFARDRQTWDYLKEKLPKLSSISDQSLSVVREIFRKAQIVIAPSTGPIHLAHLVGTPTIGLYSPVRTQLAKRWAPWGGTGPSLIFAPEVSCPGRRDCVGSRCEHFFCMEPFPWTEKIVSEVIRLLDQGR